MVGCAETCSITAARRLQVARGSALCLPRQSCLPWLCCTGAWLLTAARGLQRIPGLCFPRLCRSRVSLLTAARGLWGARGPGLGFPGLCCAGAGLLLTAARGLWGALLLPCIAGWGVSQLQRWLAEVLRGRGAWHAALLQPAAGIHSAWCRPVQLLKILQEPAALCCLLVMLGLPALLLGAQLLQLLQVRAGLLLLLLLAVSPLLLQLLGVRVPLLLQLPFELAELSALAGVANCKLALGITGTRFCCLQRCSCARQPALCTAGLVRQAV